MKTKTHETEYKPNPFCSAVIVAGGSSVRFGADKLFAPIDGCPTLARSLHALAASDCIAEILLVVRPAIRTEAEALAAQWCADKPCRVLNGGNTRAESAWIGVGAASTLSELIAIHDGARPLVSQELIRRVVSAAAFHCAAAPAVPVRDTIKRCVDSFVVETPDRSSLFAVQTPQVFAASLIRRALVEAIESNRPVTDDCSAVEALGQSVFLCTGDEENIKITSPMDIDLAEAILKRRML